MSSSARIAGWLRDRRVRFGRPLNRVAVAVMVAMLGAFGLVVAAGGVAQAAITNWSITPTPNLPDIVPHSIGGLTDVSCLSASDCVAVGSETTSSGGTETLTEVFNGTSWSIVPSPNEGAFGSSLSGVSCTSSTNCTAVGMSETNSGHTTWQTLVETYNGTSWSIVPSPNAGTQSQSLLTRVSCTGPDACVAVGMYQTLLIVVAQQTLVESWNGTSWSVVASPDPGPGDNLADVSCTSATSCVAVGTSYTTIAGQTLILSFDGTSWSSVASPNPTNADSLAGVSCTAADRCVAVGEQVATTPSIAVETLALSFDGTSWSVVASPNHQSDPSMLGSVSCLSASFCAAAGDYESPSAGFTLVETWNGSAWSTESTPNTGVSDVLVGIGCASASDCQAVGDSFDASSIASSLVVRGVDGDLSLTGVPADITTDATSSSGATVSFAPPSALDEETPPSVTCSAVPGAIFPIGTTTVTCSASDPDDTPSTASATFTVTVEGAASQLSDLLGYVSPLPPGHALPDDVQTALDDVTANDTAAACAELGQLIELADAQSGKKLTTSEAGTIVADAQQIEKVLGC